MLLLYSYCIGVFSSRKIAARCETDVAFRVIVGETPLQIGLVIRWESERGGKEEQQQHERLNARRGRHGNS